MRFGCFLGCWVFLGFLGVFRVVGFSLGLLGIAGLSLWVSGELTCAGSILELDSVADPDWSKRKLEK